MPLFECSKCHAVDNTALTNFWWSQHISDPPLCSECDPETGKWHGHFPKLTVDEYLAKYPNEKIEYLFKPEQQGKAHKWTTRRQGGSPSDAGSYERVRYCEVCGMEDPGEDGPPTECSK